MTDIHELVAAARALQEQGRDAEAVVLWRQCLRQAPEHRDRRRWIVACAEALFAAGRPAAAFALLQRQSRRQPDKADAPSTLAVLYQRAGAHDRAVPVWRDVLARFPESADRRWWLSTAAFSLIDLGLFAEAEALCEQAIAEFPQSAGGYNARATLAERRFDWAGALADIDRALAVCRPGDRAAYVAARARILGETGDIAAAEALLAAETAVTPGNIRLLAAAAALAATQGPADEALRRWQRCIAACPDAPEGYRGTAAQLRAMGDAAGACALLAEACRRFPGQVALRQALAETCAQLRDMAGAARAWQELAVLAPISIYRLWGHCAFLGACGARDEADRLLAARRAEGVVLWRGRYQYAKAARELDAALSWLQRLRDATPGDGWLACAEAEIRSWRQDDGDLERAVQVLEGVVATTPASVHARLLLAQLRVLLGDAVAAERQLVAVPASDQRRGAVEARIWQEAQHGDWTAVAARWQAAAARFFLPALHLPPAELRLAGSNFAAAAPGQILAMSIMRNERPRLPVFLAHHRRLGVDGFVIVDNGSNDGTAEYLAAQPDVRLYATEARFSQSDFGMRWLNQLIERHGTGWVLYADADERMVFPGSEGRSLAQLTAHLAAHHEQVVPAVMLDMFPGDGEGRDWFDPPRLRPSMRCPFIEAAGGARRRLFGTTVTLHKAPLIHAAAGVRYLGSHHTTPARVSGVTAAMLHDHLGYLFDPTEQRRMAEEAARAEHSDHAVDRRRMLATLQALAGTDLRGPLSRRYAGTRQLLELGLIRTTAAFEAAAAAP